jgi:dipeptidyl aminopeptidase/acylaminoacyl peptidase
MSRTVLGGPVRRQDDWTGERAFTGETTADTLTAILTKDPEEMSRPGRPVPPSLDRLVRRCLEKDPEERFQSARDVAFALEAESSPSRSGDTEVPAVPRRPWPQWAITAVVALLAAATEAWISHRVWSTPSPPPRLTQLTFGRGLTEPARFTADGHTIVFTAYWDGKPPEIRSRRLDQPESVSLGLPPARLLSVSSRGELAILLTLPGQSGITRVGTLAHVPLSGGAVRPLRDDVVDADWSPDGQDLAVVRQREGHCLLEYPVGHVLYETPFVRSLRVSPRGDRVALDDGQSLVLIDREGKATPISLGTEFSGGHLQGFAWAPHGDVLLATRANNALGGARTLRRVTLDGEVSEVYIAPGTIAVHDIARDGRVLLHHGFERAVSRGKPSGAPEEREIGGVAQGLSADGTRVLTGALASLTGEPAMRLVEKGWGLSLSDDARWAVFIKVPPDYSQLVLTPTGTGEPLRFEAPELQRGPESGGPLFAQVWHVDGDRVGFNGAEPGRPPRAFLFERSTGRSRTVTPEGVVVIRGLAPDDRVLACAADGALAIYPLSGGEARPVPARLPAAWLKGTQFLGPQVVRLSGDGRFLFLKEGNVPARIERLELATGQRTPWKVPRPSDPAGVFGIWRMFLTPDGDGYVYTYGRVLNDIYLLEGLGL